MHTKGESIRKARIMIFFELFKLFKIFACILHWESEIMNHVLNGTHAVFWVYFRHWLCISMWCSFLVSRSVWSSYFWTTLGDSPLFYRLSVHLRWNRSVSFYVISFSLSVYIAKLTISLPHYWYAIKHYVDMMCNEELLKKVLLQIWCCVDSFDLEWEIYWKGCGLKKW